MHPMVTGIPDHKDIIQKLLQQFNTRYWTAL